MKILLKKSFLDESKTLIKTKDGTLYGMYELKLKKDIIPPTYQHIFGFEAGAETTVAIRKDKLYIGLDKFGKEFELTSKKMAEYRSYIIKGDPCHCEGYCLACQGTGVIHNNYGLNHNFFFIKGFDDFDY